MNIFHVGSSADPKIMKNHYISSKNHEIFDRKLRTPKCEILMYIYRKSECESERHKFPVTLLVACWLAGWLAGWLRVASVVIG